MIHGRVTDAQTTGLSGAAVTATNIVTGVQVTRHTDGSGGYELSPLQAGDYDVEVVERGFTRSLKHNVHVDASKSVGVDVTLTPSEMEIGTLFKDAWPSLADYLNGDTISPELYTSVPGPAAAVPLFRDPIHDGAADAVVVWNPLKKVWWMFYTNRRADLPGPGVQWVHGTHIGIAESADGGAHWKYISEAAIPLPKPDTTYWAPEVIYTAGTWHMFLTVVDGIFNDWNHPRHIQHLTSKDLLHWKPLADVNLPSDKTIDACVFKLKDGTWRLWYKNEKAGSRIWYSDSKDLVHWTEKGVAIKNNSGEGPIVFQWRGSYWMLEDTAPGLSVYRSTDLENWTRQPDKILLTPGTQPTDRMEGKHPDVVVDGAGKAWIFYFTQQGGPDAEGHEPGWAKRSVLHVSELHEAGRVLTVDRNAPAYIHMLPPPVNKKSDMAAAW